MKCLAAEEALKDAEDSGDWIRWDELDSTGRAYHTPL
jgi:hypothetical protein